MESNKSILIIGKPKSAKTTFLAQFVILARKDKSKVKFWKTPENIQPIEDAIKRLRGANETQTTPAESNEVILLPIKIADENISLNCPDYGGEQINEILNLREFSPQWQTLINSSSSWIFFIRPKQVEALFDLSNKSYQSSVKESKEDVKPLFKVSEQSHLIELLQMMLHIKKCSFQKEISNPKLTIALTCWDEVDEVITPNGLLAKLLPLLNQFVHLNWHKDAVNVIGISAQGFELESQVNKDKYLNEGSTKFPYVVKNNTTEKVYDITELIAESI